MSKTTCKLGDWSTYNDALRRRGSLTRAEFTYTHQTNIMEVDRLAVRSRPSGTPVMHQTWDKLLFMHWPLPEEALRPLIPHRLRIDTFGGTAWIGLTPFTIRDLRPAGMPALPLVSTTHEVNVRTYVHCEGVPGVWFLSLDAGNPLAVLGARIGFALPYFLAWMTLEDQEQTLRFTARRKHLGAPSAGLDVAWRGAEALPEARPGSLAFFLIERYCLYAARGNHLLRARIHHVPWSLRRAELVSFSSTMLEAHGLSAPEAAPLLHGQAAPLKVDVWAPRRL